MQSLTAVLLLAVVSVSVATPDEEDFHARVLANLQCNGVPVSAPVEIMQANNNEAEHDHLVTIDVNDGKLDATAHAIKKNYWHVAHTLEDLVPDFFLRIHHNCGCGEAFDTIFVPHNQAYLDKAEAIAKPFDYGVVELSKCI